MPKNSVPPLTTSLNIALLVVVGQHTSMSKILIKHRYRKFMVEEIHLRNIFAARSLAVDEDRNRCLNA